MVPSFSAEDYGFAEYVPARNFIGGSWRDPSGSETLEVVNPRHGRAMSQVGLSTAEDVDAAGRRGRPWLTGGCGRCASERRCSTRPGS